MSDIIDFSLDDAKIVKNQGAELFKQSKSGEKHRVSIISFKRYHDGLLAKKAAEKKAPLTDQEKAELTAKIDENLANQLKKEVKDLTEVDRLNWKEPRFSVGFTHYNDQVGTIRCLSKYEGAVVTHKELCCDKFNEADQTVATVVMTYPVDEHLQVEMDILKARKMTNFYIWRMGSKKFKKLEATYIDARNSKIDIVDLKVTLDGDPKYQKQQIESCQGAAFWARADFDPAVRGWILDQGLRLYRHIGQNLGFEMTKDKLIEKLGAASQSAAALSSGEAGQASPKAVPSYEDLLS
jgi:hypothetical protein